MWAGGGALIRRDERSGGMSVGRRCHVGRKYCGVQPVSGKGWGNGTEPVVHGIQKVFRAFKT